MSSSVGLKCQEILTMIKTTKQQILNLFSSSASSQSAPQSLAQQSLAPQSLAQQSLVPQSLTQQSPAPQSLAPAQLSPRYLQLSSQQQQSETSSHLQPSRAASLSLRSSSTRLQTADRQGLRHVQMTCEILKEQIADIQTQLNNMSKSNVKPELRRQDPAPLAPFEANLIHPDHPIHIYAFIENWESLSDPEFRIQEIEKRGPLKEEKDIVNILSFWKFKVETPPALYMVYITDVDDDTITKFLARFMRLFDEKDIGKVNFLTVLLKKNKTDLQFIHINEKQFPLLHISEAESGLQDGGKALYRLIYKTLADVFEAKQPWVSFYDSTFLSPNLAACSSPDSLTLYPFDLKDAKHIVNDPISTRLPAQGEFINILVCVPYLSVAQQSLTESNPLGMNGIVLMTLETIYLHVQKNWQIGHAILVFSSPEHVENTKKEEIRHYFMKHFNFDNVLFCTMVNLRRKDDKSRTNYLEPQNMKEICQALLNTKTYRQPTFQLQDIFLSMS